MPFSRNSNTNHTIFACIYPREFGVCGRPTWSPLQPIFAMFLLAIAIFPFSGMAEPGAFLTSGKPVPLTELSDLSGVSQAFPASNSWSMVFFWSLFCHSCIEEMPIVSEEILKLRDLPLKSFFISLDTIKMKKGVENFLKKRNMSINVLLEEIASDSFKAADKWGVRMTPSVFLVNPDGKVKYSREGPFDPEEMLKILRETVP